MVSRGDQSPRHLGRVEDPAVREDGGDEPLYRSDVERADGKADDAEGTDSADVAEGDASVAFEPSATTADETRTAPLPRFSLEGEQASGKDDPVATAAAPSLPQPPPAPSSAPPPKLEPPASRRTMATPVPNASASEQSASASEQSASASEQSASASEQSASASEQSAEASEQSAEASEQSAEASEQSAEASEQSAEAKEEVTPGEPPSFKRTGHPVRDRLLAKAAEAQAEQADRDAVGKDIANAFTSLGNVESELLKVASSARPKPATQVRIGGAPLSSASVLLLGTVFGLATFALLFALLLEFAPRSGQQVVVVPSEPVPAASSLPGVQASQVLEAPPPRERLPGPWRIATAGSGQRIIRGSIGKDPFLRAIQEAGLAKTQAYRVYTALKDEKNLDRCRPSDEFVALLASDGKVLAFEYLVSKEEIYQAREGDDGLLKGKQLDLKVEKARVQGAIVMASASFANSASAAHFDPGLGVVINKALEGHTSVEEFQLGDRLRVIAQEVTVLGEFYRYAGIEALEYLPAQGKSVRVYYFPNRKRYYDARGRAPGEGGWRRPVKGAPITSKFNPARMHPILKKRMPHNGTDFGAPTGTPVYASASGTIRKHGNYGANGNFIAIEHARGYETGYSHLSRFEPGLKVGDRVARMQVVGYVGSTGRSTGPHLHFSAKKDGKFIDPESLGLDALTTLPKDELALFKQVRDKYDALLDEVALPEALVAQGPIVEASSPQFDSDDSELAFAATQPQAPVPAVAATAQLGLPSVGTPSGPGPAQPAVPPPAPRIGAALYMTDRELMEMQAGSDDGEVAE